MNKTIFAIYLACLTYGCNAQTTVVSNGQKGGITAAGVRVNKGAVAEQTDSLAYYKKRSDSLYYVVWARNYRLDRIKFYWGLYRKNPKYLKFLNSWIQRALN
ncbi:MAG TPA: hypothetical protein VKR32_11560 [Puia sp.]|nr:hypothetical protein [Puia sp.]